MLSPLKAPGRCAEAELGIMEFAVGKPADDSGTRPRVNSRGSRHPFISRWRCGRAGRTSRQDKHPLEHGRCEEWKCLAAAARAWSWLPCWGSWCCSCVAAPKVGELGRPAPGAAWQPRRVCALADGGRTRARRTGIVSAKNAAQFSSSVDGELDSHGAEQQVPWAARQHGPDGFYLLCRFPSFQHKATRIAACPTPECVCLGGPSRVILNSSPAKSVISTQSCKLLFRRSSVLSDMY